MIIWAIFLTVALIFFFAVIAGILGNLIMQRRFIKDLTDTPDCAALFDYSRKNKIKIMPSMIVDADDYYWGTNVGLPKIITVSITAKNRKIMPENSFLRKIIFAHEICHTEQENLYFGLRYSCKLLIEGNCIYLEIDAWNKAFKLLSRLKLFKNEWEIKNFWEYVNSKPDQERFSRCKIKIRDGLCPKTLELRTKIHN